MENEQETKEEFEIDPVEIHPEMYAANLFGEKTASEDFSEKSSDVAARAWPDFSPKSSSAFNIFALTDAIGARNKREAWMLYRKALASGMVPEEVFFKLVWQVKTMLVASRTGSAEEAEMKTFPYNKAKGFLKNFKASELEKLSEALVRSYHELRRGHEDAETMVEKALLSL